MAEQDEVPVDEKEENGPCSFLCAPNSLNLAREGEEIFMYEDRERNELDVMGDI